MLVSASQDGQRLALQPVLLQRQEKKRKKEGGEGGGLKKVKSDALLVAIGYAGRVQISKVHLTTSITLNSRYFCVEHCRKGETEKCQNVCNDEAGEKVGCGSVGRSAAAVAKFKQAFASHLSKKIETQSENSDEHS